MSLKPVDQTKSQNSELGNGEAIDTEKNGRSDQKAASATQARPWPVTALGYLLILQALGLFSIGAFHFMVINVVAVASRAFEMPTAELLSIITHNSVISLIFIPLSLLAFVAGIGFFRLWRSAWLNAMLVQGFGMTIALALYLGARPSYIYVVMVYSIFMVVYLHYSDVRITFHAWPARKEQIEER